MFENLNNKNVNAKTLIKTSIQVCVVKNINSNKVFKNAFIAEKSKSHSRCLICCNVIKKHISNDKQWNVQRKSQLLFYFFDVIIKKTKYWKIRKRRSFAI